MWDTDVRMVIPSIASRFDGVRCRTVSNFNAWVELTIIIEKILDAVPLSKRKAEQGSGNTVKQLDDALVDWLVQVGDNYVETATMSVPTHMMLLKLVCPSSVKRLVSLLTVDQSGIIAASSWSIGGT